MTGIYLYRFCKTQGSARGGRARKVFPPGSGEEKVFEGLASLSRFCARVLCPKAADPQNGPDNEYFGAGRDRGIIRTAEDRTDKAVLK